MEIGCAIMCVCVCECVCENKKGCVYEKTKVCERIMYEQGKWVMMVIFGIYNKEKELI
jgi:hypothetical protein